MNATTIEPLEARIAPATLTGKSLAYTDADGDSVIIKFTTKGALTAANFEFDTAFDATGSQTLRKIILNDPKFGGTGIAMKVTHGPGMSDGLADIGLISTNVDLGVVSIFGDLGAIIAGDADKTLAIAKLTTNTLGLKGTTTQAPGGNLQSTFTGPAGSVFIKGDLFDANITFGAALGSLTIGGSLFSVGPNTSNIVVSGKAGSIAILGSIQGSGTNLVGASGESQPLVAIGGPSASLTVGGSLGKLTLGKSAPDGNIYGGAANDAGFVEINGDVKTITIAGGIYGAAGSNSGRLSIGGNVGVLKMGGGIYGGSSAGDYSGAILVGGDLKKASIATLTGGIYGSGGRYSGYVSVDGICKNITVGKTGASGGIFGGTGQESGVLYAEGGFGKITILGSLASGTGPLAGALDSNGPIGSISIKGNVLGTAAHPVNITAWHNAAPAARKNPTLGSLTVTGDATGLLLRAGYNDNAGVDADAQIGKVKITGNFIDSSIVASIRDFNGDGFGNDDDTPLASFPAIPNLPPILATIGSVTIGGKAGTTAASPTVYGIVAQLIGSVKVNGGKIPLLKGQGNDSLTIITGDPGDQIQLLIREPGIAV